MGEHIIKTAPIRAMEKISPSFLCRKPPTGLEQDVAPSIQILKRAILCLTFSSNL